MKKASLILSSVIMTAIMVTSCGGDTSKEFKEVTVGNQVWMAENLNVNEFQNGEPIPEAKTEAEWRKAGENEQPAWCYYDNNPANGEKYGKLYNWYALNDPRGLAPEGWHVPSNEEWKVLTENLGGAYQAGKKMKSITGWHNDDNGTNESGFSGLPGGYRTSNGAFYSDGKKGSWWSSSNDFRVARFLFLDYDYGRGYVYGGRESKRRGLSIRLLNDIKVIKKTNSDKIDTKYIGNWSNDNPDLFYISMGHIEITNKTITYNSGEFAEYLNYKIENDKILLFYNGMEGSLKWNSDKKEDAKPKCKTQIGYITKEGNSLVLNIQNDVCGRLPNGKHVLGKHIE